MEVLRSVMGWDWLRMQNKKFSKCPPQANGVLKPSRLGIYRSGTCLPKKNGMKAMWPKLNYEVR
jgi:hypothetical protein